MTTGNEPAPLTRRQTKALEFYRAYIKQHGCSPTLAELAQHMGVSTPTAYGHVRALVLKDRLVQEQGGVSRGYKLPEAG